MANELVKMSKFLSLVLRHKPEEIGLALDANGWAEIEELIRLSNEHGVRLTRPLLEQLVAESEKQRFALHTAEDKIRANQGHSVAVALGLPESKPPQLLYHGTATRFLDSIRATGLHAGSRQHVHLSLDIPTATQVGQRHGRVVVLVVHAGNMSSAGHKFYLSANGVWLTNGVQPEFLEFPE